MERAQLSSKRGMNAERLAADFLTAQGLRILCTNYRARRGEIDVVAIEQNTMCFVEVKYRRSNRFGAAVLFVSPQKIRALSFAANDFLCRNGFSISSHCFRFDVLTIEGFAPLTVTWYRDAFGVPSDF
jgi:putative endonuclease